LSVDRDGQLEKERERRVPKVAWVNARTLVHQETHGTGKKERISTQFHSHTHSLTHTHTKRERERERERESQSVSQSVSEMVLV